MVELAGLSMVQMHLSAPALMKLGREKGLPMRQVDTGYLIHCQLGETFGDGAPQPFRVRNDSGRWFEILAYSAIPGQDLQQRAAAFAEPSSHAAVDWDRFASKQMPAHWPEDARLGFSVRICPVVRAASETQHYSRGSEVDVFLTRSGAPGEDGPGREQIYREWFCEQIERRGGAKVLDCRLDRFKLERFTRRTQGRKRKARILTRPDATLSGVLRIAESNGFSQLLARGVGRHRAFGFGMLLLRPV